MATIPGREQIIVSEMERIFEPLAGRSQPRRFQPGLERDNISRRSRSSAYGASRRLGVATLILAALVIATLTFQLAGTKSTGLPAARTKIDAATLATPSSTSSSRRRPLAPRPFIDPGPSPYNDIHPQTGGTRLSAGSVSALQRNAVETPTAPKTRAPHVARVLIADAVPEHRIAHARKDPLPTEARCVPGSLEDRCIYEDVLKADSRLRNAYGRAVQSGVRGGDLASIRRRWNHALRYANDEPDDTILQYGRLSEELDDLSLDERR